MITIVLRTLKDCLGTTLAYCAGSIIFLWMYIGLFPYIKDQAVALSGLLDAYPKGFMEAFGITNLQDQFAHLGSFLSTEMFSLMFPIMLVALVVGLATSALAGEVEKGTIELLLSQPISRLELYFGKYLAATKSLALFVAVSVFSIAPLAAIYHADFDWGSLVRFAVIAFLFGLSILSLGFLASSLFSDKGKPSFSVTGVVIVMYVLNVIAGLKPSLVNLKYVSLFHYYDPASTLGAGALLDARAVWVFIGISAVATILGALWFNHRDLATS